MSSSKLLQVDEIPNKAQVLLSPFTPPHIIKEVVAKQCQLYFYDTTLQGLADPRVLKKIVMDSIDILLYSPFYGNDSDIKTLKSFAKENGIQFIALLNDDMQPITQIYKIYSEAFKETKDFTFFSQAYPGEIFPIFLEPEFFCPKEDIVHTLRGTSDKIEVIHLPHKHPLTRESIDSLDLYGASECQKSFVGLPLDITKNDAENMAKNLLKIMDDHSLRRCSF